MKNSPKDKSSLNNLEYENILWGQGIDMIAGVDECGRGCFAGPVVSCAVIMPKNLRIERLTDSKLIPKKEHKTFADKVKEVALDFSIGIASVSEIDRYNIKEASRMAMVRAVEGLKLKPGYILVDGTEVLKTDINQQSIIKGDYHSHTISAAAIIAKVFRDELMTDLDEDFGGIYNWSENAGYQTKKHLESCDEFGVTVHHRKTWKTMTRFNNK